MNQQDIYNRPRQLERINKHLDEDFPNGNTRKTLTDFETYLFSQSLSITRIVRYLECMRWVAEKCKEINLQKLDGEQIGSLLKKLELQDWEDWTKYSYRMTIRKFLNYLGRKDLLELVKSNTPKKRKLPDELLTKADIEKMIEVAEHPRDKAFIALLYESGARISEIAMMSIKNVTFDDRGAVIMLAKGKTGMRRIRIVFAASFLNQWIENHPMKNRDAPLWINIWRRNIHKPLQYPGFRNIIIESAKKAGITKRVYLHLTRHSRATHLAEHMTEQQMKNYLGWTQGSNMAAIYVHLSGKDLDNAVLKMYGMQKDDEMVDPMKPGNCPRCKELNPHNAKFCFKCGMPLDVEIAKTVEMKDSNLLIEFIELIKKEPKLMEIIKGATREVNKE